MQNGKWSKEILAGADLSQTAGLLLTTAGIVQTSSITTDTFGPQEINAATFNVLEPVWVTFAGTGTCIAGAAINPNAEVMSDGAGGVITHVAGVGAPNTNIVIGKYVPELRGGQPALAAAAGDQITVHIYADKGNAY